MRPHCCSVAESAIGAEHDKCGELVSTAHKALARADRRGNPSELPIAYEQRWHTEWDQGVALERATRHRACDAASGLHQAEAAACVGEAGYVLQYSSHQLLVSHPSPLTLHGDMWRDRRLPSEERFGMNSMGACRRGRLPRHKRCARRVWRERVRGVWCSSIVNEERIRIGVNASLHWLEIKRSKWIRAARGRSNEP